MTPSGLGVLLGLALAAAPEAKPQAHYSPSGVFGDATLATPEKGRVIVEGVVADILEDVDALAREGLPPGAPRSPLVR